DELADRDGREPDHHLDPVTVSPPPLPGLRAAATGTHHRAGGLLRRGDSRAGRDRHDRTEPDLSLGCTLVRAAHPHGTRALGLDLRWDGRAARLDNRHQSTVA